VRQEMKMDAASVCANRDICQLQWNSEGAQLIVSERDAHRAAARREARDWTMRLASASRTFLRLG
jgi:hypothetical protein